MLSIDGVQKANSGHPAYPSVRPRWPTPSGRTISSSTRATWADRDRFVLSAGHGWMLLYSLLYFTGSGLTLEDLKSFRQFESKTPGHPESHMTAGIEVTTGPLGKGFPTPSVSRSPKPISPPPTIARRRSSITTPTSSQATATSWRASRRSRLARRPSATRETDRALRRQSRLARRADGGHLHRGRVGALRGLRLARAASLARTATTYSRSSRIAAAKADPRPSIIAVRTIIGYVSPRADTFAAHGEPLGPET